MGDKKSNLFEDILNSVGDVLDESEKFSHQARNYYNNASSIYRQAQYMGSDKFKEDSKIIAQLREYNQEYLDKHKKWWIRIAVMTLIILIFL